MASPDRDEFRQAAGLLPAGVTVVTAFADGEPAGATASAVCSLSLDPMMMLACLDRGSRTLLAVQGADRFGISVLGAGQQGIARTFATKAPPAEKWRAVEWSGWEGVPAIEGSLALLACELRDVISAGDHVILTGRVEAVEAVDDEACDPLVHFRGAFRALDR